MPARDDNLVWIDLEMTGLDPDADTVIEIATVVTDSELNALAEGPVMAIHASEDVLAGMDEWNTTHHGDSGLLERVRTTDATLADAEAATLEFLRGWSARHKSPMCGNSICQDRRFLARTMPALEDFFHYRNLDVSSVKELVRRWAPDDDELRFRKRNTHLALDDIRESIAELRHYRKHVFRI